jgi:deazaflavin-dependent oxidoreductase (nitroreductase family)
MTDTTTTFEDMLIEQMRANGGEIVDGPLTGHPVAIVTTRGARSGRPRRALLTISRDGQDLVAAGTAGGSPTTPAWVHNMRTNPDVTVEFQAETFPATVEVIADGPERDRLWTQHVAALPHFAPYPDQTGRLIPMARIRRAG